MNPGPVEENRQVQPEPGFAAPWIRLRWSTLGAIFLLSAALLIGLWSLFGATDTTAQRVAHTGVIRIGYALEAPFAFHDDQGRVTGESPEVARAVWQRLGVRHIEWVRTDFGSLIAQLRAGRFDQIACGLFIRPDRERLVAFTSPSVCIGPALLVRRGNPLHLHSFADITGRDGVRLAVIAGAVEGEDAAKAGVPPDRIVSYPNLDVALNGIRNNLVDALALSAPTIQRLADQNADLQRALPFQCPLSKPGCGAFAFRPADKKLRDRFDRALREYIGTEAHLELIRPFGMNKDNLPGSLQRQTKESVP